ncbi:MAG: hypothetical protein E7270_02995 [Lachnospiraceae bacterium]|nr:hypothetical protein [Lachnospiraceae bacterium]
MQYSSNNPYHDYSDFLHDITQNGDELFNEKIRTDYQIKNNYYMLLEQLAFYKWELGIRKSYVKTYINKSKHLFSRVIIDMSFGLLTTSWFLYMICFFASANIGALGVCFQLILIAVGIIPSMGYGLNTLLEYLTTKEISFAVKISRYLGRALPGNELKDLHIELAGLERKIIELEDFSEDIYYKIEDILNNKKSFFMDRDVPFEPLEHQDFNAEILKLSMKLEGNIEMRKNLIKTRDDLLRCHKILREKTITYIIVTILAYVLYFTLYYNLSGNLSYAVSIGGFVLVLFPLLSRSAKLYFDYAVKEEFNRAMDIQKQIEALELEEKNLRKTREELEK